jgi:Mg-chelatase subunit ChlD
MLRWACPRPRHLPITARLEAALTHMPAAGMTALYDAVVTGLRQLSAGSHDKKVLLIVSDGGDNASVHGLAQVLEMAEQSKAIIYTVGVFDEADPDKNPRVLKRLARESGGESYFPESLDRWSASANIAHDMESVHDRLLLEQPPGRQYRPSSWAPASRQTGGA